MNYLFTNTPLKYLIQSIWRDEAFSYLLAKRNIFEMLVLTAKDFNPPLYYFVLKIWMFIFGASEIAMRSLSLIFYWATLYVVFLFLTEIFKLSTKKSFVYLLLFLLNPILTYYAFEARMYTMLTFFATLSFYLYHQRKIGWYQVVTALGLYTHYFMLLVVVTQFIFAVATERKKNHFPYLIKKISLPFILFIPWILFVLIQKSFTQGSFWIQAPLGKDFLLLPGTLFTGYEKELGFLTVNPNGLIATLLWISLFIVIICAYGYHKLRRVTKKDRFNLFMFLAAWTFIPTILIFFLSFRQPLFLPRYLIFSNVGLYLLLIVCFEEMKREIRIIAILLLALMMINYEKLQLKYRSKPNLEKPLREIKKLAAKNDLLYVTNELDFFVAQYYFDPNRVYIYQKTYEEIPNYVGKVLIPPDRIAKTLPLYPKKAFILRDEKDYDVQSNF